MSRNKLNKKGKGGKIEKRKVLELLFFHAIFSF
jgi:hypothetical protein